MMSSAAQEATVHDPLAEVAASFSVLRVVGVGAVTAAVGTGLACVRVVPVGHLAVSDLFGKAEKEPKPSGLHVKHPLASFHEFSLKTQKVDVTVSSPTSEGLSVELHVSVQYRIDPTKVVELYETVGSAEVVDQTIVLPQLHAAVRGVTATREAKALYTSEREMIRLDLIESLNATLNERGVTVEDCPLRAVVLPQRLTEAIERKLQMEQESEKMDWVIKKEKQEAERKAIEAKGIADFQKIVAHGIDEKLLRWKGIEATTELAKSNNAKVVVVGQGKDGLPLILGK